MNLESAGDNGFPFAGAFQARTPVNRQVPNRCEVGANAGPEIIIIKIDPSNYNRVH